MLHWIHCQSASTNFRLPEIWRQSTDPKYCVDQSLQADGSTVHTPLRQIRESDTEKWRKDGMHYSTCSPKLITSMFTFSLRSLFASFTSCRHHHISDTHFPMPRLNKTQRLWNGWMTEITESVTFPLSALTLFIIYHIISPTFTKAPLTQCSTAPYSTTQSIIFFKLKKNNNKY